MVLGDAAILMDDTDQFHILSADQHIEFSRSELFSRMFVPDDAVSVKAFLVRCFHKYVDSFGIKPISRCISSGASIQSKHIPSGERIVAGRQIASPIPASTRPSSPISA